MPNNYPGIANLLDNSLYISRDDKVLIASDLERDELINEVSDEINSRGISYSIVKVDYDGEKIPPELSSKLLDDEHNVLLLFFGKSIWHQPERRTAKYEKKKRLVAFSGNLEMLNDGPALADPQKLERLCNDLKPPIENGKKIILSSPNGTYIKGECERIDFETGVYANPAEGGNFPAGEGYAFKLIEETVNGYIHSNVKVRHLGLSSPENNAIFRVRKGKISYIDKSTRFYKLIQNNEELFSIAELAFGICPYAKVFKFPDSMPEEKILGTAHVGLGSDISFGGNRRGRHLDVVFGPASVTINDNPILIEGKLIGDYLSEQSKNWIRERGFLY